MARGPAEPVDPVPPWVEPMLAKPDGGVLRGGPEWTYEYKLDGYRASMRVAPDGTTVLTSRNGIDFTPEFTSLVGVLAEGLDGRAAVLDGEIVVYGADGRIEFGELQQRRGRYRKHAGSPWRDEVFHDVAEVRYLAFDLLRLGDRSLLDRPYDERRALLERLPMPDPHRVSVVPAFTFDSLAADRRTPATLLDAVAAAGYEGLIAKLRASPYVPGARPDSWLKHPIVRTQEVLVCGWRPGQNRFTGMVGGLLLGAHDPVTGALVYIGDVGTGFTDRDRHELRALLVPLERSTHPFAADPPRDDVRRGRWVEPRLVGEVRYRQFTRGADGRTGRLRHTAWRGLREDRAAADVVAPRAAPDVVAQRAAPEPPAPRAAPAPPARQAKRVTVRAGERQLVLSNLDKPLYPDGFTKAQVIHYYSTVAPFLLPHLRDRPVTFVRYPDGVAGEHFYEKNVPRGAPDWIRTVRLPSGGSRDTVEHALLDELPALVWAANLAALELHVPQWTIGPGTARRVPDRLVFDLDPGPGTSVVECARVAERLHDVLVADGLTPVAKTSGSKGMQVCAGVRGVRSGDTSAYAKAVAQRFAARTPDLVTATMAKAARPGRVFIDWSQNNPAKTTVAPYSLRGREHPTASTPVTWAEVRACSAAEQLVFTAEDVVERVRELGDLFAVLEGSRAGLPTG
ncbi:DNA ligase D [Umezawaea sp.]|uniref:DNA ligase D n=1 Tax=Umezawaea sp. TaxID=1955258 RepID=UPI002ED0FA8E